VKLISDENLDRDLRGSLRIKSDRRRQKMDGQRPPFSEESSPEHWRWSSYGFYLSDEAGPVRVNEGLGKISFQASAA
jgi:hypothetical protein